MAFPTRVCAAGANDILFGGDDSGASHWLGSHTERQHWGGGPAVKGQDTVGVKCLVQVSQVSC